MPSVSEALCVPATQAPRGEVTAHIASPLASLLVYNSFCPQFAPLGPQSPSVPTLDPRTRCFSDLPAWLDEHAYDKLAGRTVLMYCTGGVRCERASAYLREMGPAFSNVYQLQGERVVVSG